LSKASATAFETIKAEIINGRYAPGRRLKEDELTALCAVSRTPVREALRRLANEGLVTLIPNQGAQVALMGATELADLYELRTLVEGYAAARAAVRISPAEIAELKSLASQIETAAHASGALPADNLAAANTAFHRIILRAASSARLEAVAQIVIEAPLALRTLIRYSPAELERSIIHHRELIAAFEAGDPEWARAVMSSHIKAAIHVLLRDRELALPQPASGI
jgi:DNA-binding GntR family transcriptional regulator